MVQLRLDASFVKLPNGLRAISDVVARNLRGDIHNLVCTVVCSWVAEQSMVLLADCLSVLWSERNLYAPLACLAACLASFARGFGFGALSSLTSAIQASISASFLAGRLKFTVVGGLWRRRLAGI